MLLSQISLKLSRFLRLLCSGHLVADPGTPVLELLGTSGPWEDHHDHLTADVLEDLAKDVEEDTVQTAVRHGGRAGVPGRCRDLLTRQLLPQSMYTLE